MWLVFFYKFKTTYSPEKVLKSIRIEVDKLFTEIMRTTEEDVTLIEARIQGLKDLISQADERILLAENELAKRQNEKQVLASLETKKSREPKSKNLNQRKLSRYEQNVFDNTMQPSFPSLIEENVQNDFGDAVEVSVQQSLFVQNQGEQNNFQNSENAQNKKIEQFGQVNQNAQFGQGVPGENFEQFGQGEQFSSSVLSGNFSNFQPNSNSQNSEQFSSFENNQSFENFSSNNSVNSSSLPSNADINDFFAMPTTPKEKIEFYFNQGFELEQIAEKINVPLSQVRLVVSMYEASKNHK